MSDSKHLWSDGWERDATPAPPGPAPDPAAPSVPADVPAPRTPFFRRPRERLAMVAAGVVVAVGVVVALSHSSSDTPHSSTGADRLAIRRPPAAPRQANALGLRLAAGPTGGVVVQSVVPGSAATSVGIGPGQTLQSLNGRPATSPEQVNALLAKLPAGTPLTMQLTQGSAQITAQIQDPGLP